MQNLLPLLFVLVFLHAAACGSDAQDEPYRVWDVSMEVDMNSSSNPNNTQSTPDMTRDDQGTSMDEDMPVVITPTQCPGTRAIVTVPAIIEDTLPFGVGAIEEHSCVRAKGIEHTYTLVVPKTTVVRIFTTYQNDETLFGPVLTLRRTCNASEDTYCSNPLRADVGTYNSYIQDRLEAGIYVLTIDQRSIDPIPQGGAYKVYIEEYEDRGSPASVCEDATPMNIGETINGAFALDGTTGKQNTCFRSFSAAHFYSVEIPARSSVSITATGLAQNPSLAMHKSCDTPLDQCQLGDLRQKEINVANPSSTSQRYILAVQGPVSDSYTISSTLSSIGPNEMCEKPERLSSPDAMASVDFDTSSTKSTICNGDKRRALFYSYEVPPKSRLFTSGVGVEVLESCQTKLCFNQRFGFVNDLEQPRGVILRAVEHNVGNPNPTSLSVTSVSLASNATCDQPMALNFGDTLTNQDMRQGGEPHTMACSIVMPSLTRFYTLTFEIGLAQRAKIRVTPDDEQNVSTSIQVIDLNVAANNHCTSMACATKDDAYFRSTPVAEVELDYGTIGSGEQYATALIAVSMSVSDITKPGTYKLEVIPQQ